MVANMAMTLEQTRQAIIDRMQSFMGISRPQALQLVQVQLRRRSERLQPEASRNRQSLKSKKASRV